MLQIQIQELRETAVIFDFMPNILGTLPSGFQDYDDFKKAIESVGGTSCNGNLIKVMVIALLACDP